MGGGGINFDQNRTINKEFQIYRVTIIHVKEEGVIP